MKLKDNSTQEIDTALYQLEQRLKSNIRLTDVENSNASSAKINAVDKKLTEEVKDRQSADGKLQDNINKEIADRQEADAAIENAKQDKLIAGDNIQINGNIISATSKEYTAEAPVKVTDGKISLDTVPITKGGTGVTTQADINKAFISNLTVGNDNVTDGTEFVSSYASDNGFADPSGLNKPYKRQFIKVWNYIKGKADSVYAALTHTHTKSQITDFPTSLKNPNALTVNGKTYDGSEAVDAGVQTVENGGTGATTAKDAFMNLANGLSEGTGPLDTEYMIYKNTGGTNWGLYTLSHFWEYIKGKISSVLGLTKDNYGGKASTAGNADTVDNYHASQLWRSDGATWNPNANVSLGATANGDEWSFDISRNGHTGCYWHVWDSSRSSLLKVNADDGKVSAPYGFVGNLSGKADTADKATNDGNGNNIVDTYALKSDLQYTKSINISKANGSTDAQYYLIAETLGSNNASNVDSLFVNGSDYMNRMFEGSIRTRDGNFVYNYGKNNLPIELYEQTDGTIYVYLLVSDTYNSVALNITATQSIVIYGGDLSPVTPTGSKMTLTEYDYKSYETLPVERGGTGQTTANAAANSFITSLTTGESVPEDNDYYVSQYVNGGTTTTTYHRRPVSKLWEYIKGKILQEGEDFGYDHIVHDGASLLEWANCTDGSMKKVLIKSGTYNITKGVDFSKAGTGYVFAEQGAVINSHVPIAFTASSGKTVAYNLNVVCDGAANGDNSCAFSADNPESLILYNCSATYRTYTEIVNRNLFVGCTCYNCSYAFQNLPANSSISMKVFYQCRCYNCKCKQTIEANSSTGIIFDSESYFYKECHCASCDAELTTSRNIKASTNTFVCYYNCYDRCVGCLSKINVNSKAVTVYSTLYGFLRCQYMSSCKETHTEGYSNIKGIVQCDFISSTTGINGGSNTHVGNSCSIQ